MIDEFKEIGSRDKFTDAINRVINDTIEHFIDDDYLYRTMPILSKKSITKYSDFWNDFKISLNRNIDFTEDELRTISYLAPFYKNKAKYNIKEVVRYLQFIGYEANEDTLSVECFDRANYDKDTQYDDDFDNKYITMEEYLLLSYFDVLVFNIEVDILKGVNNSGNLQSKLENKIYTVTNIKSIDDNQKMEFANLNTQLIYADGFDLGWDMIGMK